VRASVAERALRDGAAATEVARLAARDVADDYRRALLMALTERVVRQVLV
jgi:hypothetical protein